MLIFWGPQVRVHLSIGMLLKSFEPTFTLLDKYKIYYLEYSKLINELVSKSYLKYYTIWSTLNKDECFVAVLYWMLIFWEQLSNLQ